MIYKNINININNKVFTELLKIYGIGKSIVRTICTKYKLYGIYINKLTKYQQDIITNYLNNYLIDNDLRVKIKSSIDKLININCYRGIRHKIGLPVRGQRTRTNAKTIKRLYNK